MKKYDKYFNLPKGKQSLRDHDKIWKKIYVKKRDGKFIILNIPNYDNKIKSTKEKNQTVRLYARPMFSGAYMQRIRNGKTNTLIHMLLKPLIYYDKIYLYAKNLEQDKYSLLIESLTEIAGE